MSTRSLTIGVDIGGTKVAAGVVDPAGQVLARTHRATPAQDVAGARQVVAEVVGELASTYPVTAVGVGAAGWIDTEGTVRYAPNLAWRDEPLRDTIATAVDLPVRVENDGNAAAWGEYRFGAGRTATDAMVLVTVGTGIGGGIVLGGRLHRGAHGMGAEMGHTFAVPDGLPCGCGRRGCLEQYASGTALVRFARTAAAQSPRDAATLWDLAGGDAAAISGPVVTSAARAGDRVATEAFHRVGWWLARGLADLVQVLDPQVLVIGGGVAEAGELLMAPVHDAYHAMLAQRGRLPAAPVVVAALGGAAGVVGAADLARE